MAKLAALAGTACALGPFASAPEVAQAKPGYTVHPSESWRVFGLRGTHGYTVLAVFQGRRVTIEAISPDSVVSYTVPARKKRGKFTARIGRLGFVSMRFKPVGPYSASTEPQGDCRGRRARIQRGFFEGIFRWRGEQGFAEAKVHRIAGISLHSYREVCRGETAAIGRDEADEPLIVARSTGGREAREVEIYDSGGEGVTLVARSIEKRPSLDIERTVISLLATGQQMDAEGNRIIVGKGLFRGAAELRANPDEVERWRGSLEAFFPGKGYLALAGSGFDIEDHAADPSIRPVGI